MQDILCVWMFWKQGPQHNSLPAKPLAIRVGLLEDTDKGPIENKLPKLSGEHV